MPDLETGVAGSGVVVGGGVGGGGGGGGGGAVGGGSVDGNGAAQQFDGAVGPVDGAVQDDAERSCDEIAEELAAENEVLRSRVVELESALAGVESRFELERALTDAGAVDLETALAVSASRVAEGEAVASIVSELMSSKPFLFRASRSSGRGSALGGAAARSESSLSGLAAEARQTGDRRALTRYLRKRRGV